MVVEVTVIVKDEEKSLKFKSLVYENFNVNTQDPTLAALIDKAVKDFKGTPEEIKIKISLSL